MCPFPGGLGSKGSLRRQRVMCRHSAGPGTVEGGSRSNGHHTTRVMWYEPTGLPGTMSLLLSLSLLQPPRAEAVGRERFGASSLRAPTCRWSGS